MPLRDQYFNAYNTTYALRDSSSRQPLWRKGHPCSCQCMHVFVFVTGLSVWVNFFFASFTTTSRWKGSLGLVPPS